MTTFVIELSTGKTVHASGDEAVEHKDGLAMNLEIRTGGKKTAYYTQVVGYKQKEKSAPMASGRTRREDQPRW